MKDLPSLPEMPPEIVALSAKYQFPTFPHDVFNELNQHRLEALDQRCKEILRAAESGGQVSEEGGAELLEAQAWRYAYIKAQQAQVEALNAFMAWLAALPGLRFNEGMMVQECFDIAESIGDYTYRREDFNGLVMRIHEPAEAVIRPALVLPDLLILGIDRAAYNKAVEEADPDEREDIDPEDFRLFISTKFANLAQMQTSVEVLREEAIKAVKALHGRQALLELLRYTAGYDEQAKVVDVIARAKAAKDQSMQFVAQYRIESLEKLLGIAIHSGKPKHDHAD